MNDAPAILTPAYYERLDDLERRHWWCRSVRRVARAWLASFLRPGASILDAGCGAGGFLAELGSARLDLRRTGVDVSPDAARRARSRAGQVLLASASALPFRDGAFDAVLSHDVLQHLPDGDDARALAEARRVLSPGGVVSVRTNLGRDEPGARGLHRRYSPEGLASLVRASGLEVVRHALLHPLPALLGKLRGAGRCAAGHRIPEAHGLALTVPPAPLNTALDLFTRLEEPLVCALPFRVGAGDVQVLLARRTARSA